jgi:hypothetical protein
MRIFAKGFGSRNHEYVLLLMILLMLLLGKNESKLVLFPYAGSATSGNNGERESVRWNTL